MKEFYNGEVLCESENINNYLKYMDRSKNQEVGSALPQKNKLSQELEKYKSMKIFQGQGKNSATPIYSLKLNGIIFRRNLKEILNLLESAGIRVYLKYTNLESTSLLGEELMQYITTH